MANVSSVPRAKAAILAMMETALTPVQVAWMWPGQYIAKESVFMSDVEFQSEEVAALRTAPRQQDEKYMVPVWVTVLIEGNDAQAAEERMWTLVGLVEHAIRADQSLGSMVGCHSAQVAGKEPRMFVTDEATRAECMIRVNVHART